MAAVGWAQNGVPLRPAADVVALPQPSWWTSEHLLWLLLPPACAMLLAVLWVTVLRRQVEEKTETLRAALESTGDGILVMDSEGQVVTCNQRFLEMWNIPSSRDPIDDAAVLEAVIRHLQDPMAFLQRVQQLNHDPEAQTDDLIEFCNGRILQHHSEPQRVKGTSVGRVWGFRDVTESRRAQEQLERAKSHAEQASRLKSEFLANMSHEIRTPMNGILGMIRLMLSGPLEAHQRRRAETLHSSAEALLAVLNDILDLSKIEARKLELESQDFDLRSAVEGVADLLAVTAQQKGLEMLCFIETDVPTRLRGDAGRLRQMLVNLAGNAIKFTHSGQVSLRVKAETGDSPVIRFEVIDTGIGIAADKLEVLFRPFSQADASTTRQYGGTGLGLSIVARLAELMGGQAGVESQEGRGSRFWFTARLERQPGDPPKPRSLAGRRLLVVDDNASSRDQLLELLRFWQAEAEAAGDVRTALARLRSAAAPFEAVLVDLDMPGAGGERLAAQIHEDPKLADIPLVLLTALTETAEAHHWRTLGFVDRITKPVKQGELGSCLAAVLGYEPDPIGTETRTETIRCSPRETRLGLRFLLVEDNPTNQEVALGMLENLGYRADLVADGRSALHALAENDYDLVLMDCQLPELDGYETTRLVRRPDTPVRNHEIPVIAMTAHAMAGDRETCLAAGMNDYISKPISPAALAKAIERWIGTKPEAASEPDPSLPSPVPVEFVQEDLLQRLGGNQDLARRVIGRFLDDMPEHLAALAQAVRQGDGEAARRTAHSIKGAAAHIGGPQVREVAGKLERYGAAGDMDAAAGLLPDLLASFERARPLMEQFRQSVPAQ